MRRIDALELKNRTRSDAAVVVLATRRRAPACDDTARLLDGACAERGVLVVGVDVDDDDRDLRPLLDEFGVTVVPTALLFSRGVLVERACAVRDIVAARRLVSLVAPSAPGAPRAR